MPKERSINPAQAQRKADKQKDIARSKKQHQAQRNEKLARRNPERIQRQIDDLKDLEARGALRPKDKETLTQLEKDVRGIRRAREALGDKAPTFRERTEKPDARQDQHDRRTKLGKRRREDGPGSESGDDTDPEVRTIPMPRDTPPPIPRQTHSDPRVDPDGVRVPHGLPAKPSAPAPAQTVYSSAPQLRDLKKEAVRFLPTAVAQQKNRAQGKGRLLEPEEIDRLEKAGYLAAEQATAEAGLESRFEQVSSEVRAEGLTGDELDAETRRFEEELKEIFPAEAEQIHSRTVRMEEVDDDGS